MDIELYFDGSCEPRNPGGVATYGWLVKYAGADFAAEVTGWGVAAEGAGATNNVAEYAALGFALKWLAEGGGLRHPGPLPADTSLRVLGDSQLVVYQVNGVWSCNNDRLRRYLARCKELLATLCAAGASWTAGWVPREQNDRADALARTAYEQHTGKPYPERSRT